MFTPTPLNYSSVNNIVKENNNALKEIFKHKINGSFLIQIKNMVLEELGDKLFRIMPLSRSNSAVITGNFVAHEYDICRMIVGTHRHHSIFLSEQEIKKNQKDPEYKKMLVKEVINKIHLHSISNIYMCKNPLYQREEFLYYPVPYDLFALCNRSLDVIAQNSLQILTCTIDVINHALSALLLMENNMLSNAYPLCRSMIEQYFKAAILQKHPECRETYSDFCLYEIEQACCSQEYPIEFNHKFNHRNFKTSKNKVDFLHFGWLDAIEVYTCEQSNPYSLYGIIEYLKSNSDDDSISNIHHLATLYKNCHGYTHGSSNHVKYPLLCYFELSIMLYYVMKDVFLSLHHNANLALTETDKHLIEQLDSDFNILYSQYLIRSTENFEGHYNRQN